MWCSLAHPVGGDRQRLVSGTPVQCALHTAWPEVQPCLWGHQDKAWALYNVFLPLHYSYSVVFMLIVFHFVLIVQQTFSEGLPTMCLTPFQGRFSSYLWQNMIVSYVLYFLCPALTVGDPQTCDWELLCPPSEASQMGNCRRRMPIPASEGEGPATDQSCLFTLCSSGREGSPVPFFYSLLLSCGAGLLSFGASGTTKGDVTPNGVTLMPKRSTMLYNHTVGIYCECS